MTKNKNNKSLRNFLFGFWICLGFSISSLGFIKAVHALTITVIPPQIEVEVEPGQVITKTLKVKNETNQDQVLTAAVYDFIVNDDQGTPLIIEEKLEDNRWASSNWIQLSPTQIKLKPGELKGVQMTVIVPDVAVPGGKYAAVLYSPQTQELVDQSGATIDPRVGTLVYLKVKGDIKQDAKITKFQLPSFLEYGPIDILTTITNLSDIHIRPIGNISIKNIFGKVVGDLPLKPTNIFPYTSRDFENSLDKKWLFGRYQAQLTATYGTTGQALVATAYLWAIPWRLILALLIATILFFTIKKLLKKDTTKKLDNTPVDELKKKYQDKK